MAQKKSLFMFSTAVNNPNAGNKIHDFLVCGVIQVISTLVSSVAIDPLQSELACGCSLRRHSCKLRFSQKVVGFRRALTSLFSHFEAVYCRGCGIPRHMISNSQSVWRMEGAIPGKNESGKIKAAGACFQSTESMAQIICFRWNKNWIFVVDILK